MVSCANVPPHLCADVKHGHNIGVAEPVVQQGLQAAAGIEVTGNLLQHLDSHQRAIPVPCMTPPHDHAVNAGARTQLPACCLLALQRTV